MILSNYFFNKVKNKLTCPLLHVNLVSFLVKRLYSSVSNLNIEALVDLTANGENKKKKESKY